MANESQASNAGGRYAQALFELADQANALSVVEADLVGLKAAIEESAELRRLLASPTFTSEQKGRVLLAVADAGKVNPLTRKFLGLLTANNRSSVLTSAIAAFQRLAADKRGVVAAEVVTAAPLTADQKKGVSAALRQALGKDPEITTRVDPSILGGLRVRVGSRLFDASLKSRLDSLKFALKRA